MKLVFLTMLTARKSSNIIGYARATTLNKGYTYSAKRLPDDRNVEDDWDLHLTDTN